MKNWLELGILNKKNVSMVKKSTFLHGRIVSSVIQVMQVLIQVFLKWKKTKKKFMVNNYSA